MASSQTFKKLTTSKTKMESTLSLRFYLGKKVYSKSGDLVGTVSDIILSPKHSLKGLMVKNKKLSTIFIGKEYIKDLTPISIMLQIDPVLLLIGKYVFDADGKKLGKVIDLKRETESNTYEAIIIKKKPFSKPETIKKEFIDVAKKNIILSTTHN
ncbi:MAG: PRC-barrel domain-containing protein [Nanobdellota archaeon]